MGKRIPGGDDLASKVVTAAFAAVGEVSDWAEFRGQYNLFVGGAAFVGSIGLEASFDGGVTALPITAMGNDVVVTGQAVERLAQYEPGVLVRARCIAYTSGPINVRLSQ